MTFIEWLLTHEKHDDPIGDLARDVKRDTAFTGTTARALRRRLNDLNASAGAVRACVEAWGIYGGLVENGAIETGDPEEEYVFDEDSYDDSYDDNEE